MEYLQQERQNRNQLRLQQEDIERQKAKVLLLEQELAREASALKTHVQRQRAERFAQAQMLEETLASRKQAIERQSILAETRSLYDAFVSNLEVEVELAERQTESQTEATATSVTHRDAHCRLEVPTDPPTAAETSLPVEATAPTIHPELPLGFAVPPPVSVSHYKQLPTFCASSDSGLSGMDFQGDSDQESDFSDLEPTASLVASGSLEDLSHLAPVVRPAPLRRAASLGNLAAFYSLKETLLADPSPVNRLLADYSLRLSPSEYLLFLRETGDRMQAKLQEVSPSVQQAFTDYLLRGGQLYPAIVKDYAASDWLILSLVQALMHDPRAKANAITLEQFNKHWTKLSQRYPKDKQITLLHALWEAKKKAGLTLLQLTHVLEIVAATGSTGYEMACMEQPDKLVHLKHYWLLDQVSSRTPFGSSELACGKLADALAHTQLSPAFIPSLLSAVRREKDLPGLLNFLSLIAKRSVPEFIVQSTIYEKNALLAPAKSKAQQWVTSLLCQLSLMHLAQVDSDASDAVGPILYERIRQAPALAPAVEAFVYTHCQSIAANPSPFVKLLELLHNYQINEATASAVLAHLSREAPVAWIAEADRWITDRLFQASHTYSVEELIHQIVQAAPAALHASSFPHNGDQAAHYLKKATIDNVLKQRLVEDLKPSIENQLNEVKKSYAKALSTLENQESALRDTIATKEEEQEDLARRFSVDRASYKKTSDALKKEEQELRLEIDRLEKENQEKLKKSEEEVKKKEDELGEKAKEDPSKSAQTKQSEEKSVIAILGEKLSNLFKRRSDLKTTHKKQKETYEATSAELSKKIKILEVDLLKLEAKKKPIRLKLEKLSKEDPTNFSDYSLYKEVLDGFCKSIAASRTSKNRPCDPSNKATLTAWSREIKRKGSTSLFGTHDVSEIIAGINQAVTLCNRIGLTQSQHLDLLSALFPFCRQNKSHGPKDPLVVICLATICALQGGQVSLVTDSKEWPISEAVVVSHLPFFELLDLTVAKRDPADPSSSRDGHIIYGKISDFSAIPHLISYDALKQKQQSVDRRFHAPSLLLQSAPAGPAYSFKDQPISQWSQAEVRQWADYVQHHLPSPDCIGRGTLSTESIAVTQRAAELVHEVPLTTQQRYGLLTLLYPSLDKGQLLQEAKKDSLVTAMFAAIRSLQSQQSHIIPSKGLGLLTPQQPLFEALNLTTAPEQEPPAFAAASSKAPVDTKEKKAEEKDLGQSTPSVWVSKDRPQATPTQAPSGHSDLAEVAASKQPTACEAPNPVTAPEQAPAPALAAAFSRVPAETKGEKAADLAEVVASRRPTAAHFEAFLEDDVEGSDCMQESIAPMQAAAAEAVIPSAAYEELKKQYDAIDACYRSPSHILRGSSLSFKQQPISQWDRSAVTAWAKYVQANCKPGLETELIAGVKRAVELSHRLCPRPTQLLSLLTLLTSGDKGRLAQINTGEGKSLIVAMLAAIHGLQGRQVDVITTSTELSVPEVRKQTPFFKLLHLTAAENSKSSDKVAAYKCQIVYGTAGDFQADILKKEFLGEDNRGDRGHDVVLVDEVDSLLFDNRSHSVRLSSPNPGMDHLKLPLGAIWQHVQWLTDHMCECKGKVYFTPEDAVDENTQVMEIKDKKTFITEQTQKHLTSLLRRLDPTEAQEYEVHCAKRAAIAKIEQEIRESKDEKAREKKAAFRERLEKELQALPWSKRLPILDIPQHLRHFANMQIPIWINHCLNALYAYKKNAHYTVQNDRVVPIQHNETGVLQHDLVWSDGLSQFLQMKEGLTVESEGISTNFLSNIGFFKRYGQSIYGLTGTLGESATRSFLEELYGVDFVVIPPYQRRSIQDNSHTPYLCKELRPIVVEKRDWYPAILYHLLHHAKRGRAVLAICKYVSEAEYLAKQLKAHYNPNKIFTYTGVTSFEKEEVDSGEIILATNIAGRGTDLKTSEQVEANGGMYVAVTFLPESYRVELQNVGRTARAGKKGMAQLITWNSDGSSMETMKQVRADNEATTTQRALQGAKKMLVQDALFQHFCSLEDKYLPSASDCVSLDQAETIFSEWKQLLDREFTDKKIDAQFRAWSSKQKSSWDKQFSSGHVPHSGELAQALDAKKDRFREVYRAKLLETFQAKHPDLSSSLLSCLESGTPFCPKRSELAQKYDWGTFERKAVEERWGIWLKNQHRQEQAYDSGDTLPLFERFESQFANAIARDAPADKLIKNPYFRVLKGNRLLAKRQPSEALLCYDRALALDPVFSLHARYNKARALLSFKENKGTHQQEAYKELEEASKLIVTLSRPNLMAFHSLVSHGAAKTHTATAIQRDLHLIGQQENYVQNALKVLRTTRGKKPCNVKLTEQPLRATFADPDLASAHNKNILEIGLKGLVDLFTLEQVPPYPLASIVSMALISLSQITIGCLLIVYGGSSFGLSLIQSGISDMITTIKAAIKGKFDWGAWAMQKSIEIVASVAVSGIKIAKEAMLQALKGTKVVEGGISSSLPGAPGAAAQFKEGFQSGIQAIKDIFGVRSVVKGQVVDKVAIQTATGELMAKSPGQVVKDTLLTQLKQGATGQLMEQVTQWCADKVCIDDANAKIRKAVRNDLTEAFASNQLIAKALALDRQKGNNYWQQCFLQEAGQILDEKLKSNPELQIVTQFGREVTTGTVPYANETLLLLGGLKAAYEYTSALTQAFLREFDARIATYAQSIEQHQQAGRQTQRASSSNIQATTIADPPPIDPDDEEIVIHAVDDITSFRAPDRTSNQTKLETDFSNPGPSTVQNLVRQLEACISGAMVQELHNGLKPIVSYGVSATNYFLYKEVNKENQAFLDVLSAGGLRRYAANAAEAAQQKLDQSQVAEPENATSNNQGKKDNNPGKNKKKNKKKNDNRKDNKNDNNQQAAAPTHAQTGGKQPPKKQSELLPDAEEQRKVLESGGPLTLGHMRVAGHLSESPIHVFDEHGKLLEVIGDYKSGEPISLRLVVAKDGGLAHIEPMNPTEKQREHYESLDHTKQDCVLNALFVHLPKEKQMQFGNIQGLRQACSAHMLAEPKLANDLFKYEARLSQLDPMQVPKAGAALLPALGLGVLWLSRIYGGYQLYETGKDIANDPQVQKNLQEGNYMGALGAGVSSDAASDAALNAGMTLFGGKLLGTAGKWGWKKVAPKLSKSKFGKLGVGKWLGESGDCAKQGDKALQPKNTISAAKKGLQREHKVAKITGGRIMKNAKGQDVEINVKGVGKTGLDVVGKNGEYITVGGPAKAKNIDGLKSRLHVLRKAAERDGVKAQAYFSKDTPKEAIEAAKKMLGNDNVFIFNE